LHEDKEKAEVAFLLTHGQVVAFPHIGGNRLVELLLGVMLRLPWDRHEFRDAGLEERFPGGVDGVAFLGANDVGQNPLLGHTGRVREGGAVEQCEKAVKGIGLALVRRGREKEQIRRRLGQSLSKLVPGDMGGTAAKSMGFVYDDQVPASADEIEKAVLVELRSSLCGSPQVLRSRGSR
jgi:hypothetical protein